MALQRAQEFRFQFMYQFYPYFFRGNLFFGYQSVTKACFNLSCGPLAFEADSQPWERMLLKDPLCCFEYSYCVLRSEHRLQCKTLRPAISYVDYFVGFQKNKHFQARKCELVFFFFRSVQCVAAPMYCNVGCVTVTSYSLTVLQSKWLKSTKSLLHVGSNDH